jgi:hypothetical protein
VAGLVASVIHFTVRLPRQLSPAETRGIRNKACSGASSGGATVRHNALTAVQGKSVNDNDLAEVPTVHLPCVATRRGDIRGTRNGAVAVPGVQCRPRGDNEGS